MCDMSIRDLLACALTALVLLLPSATVTAQPIDQGITFGPPVVFRGPFVTVGVLATNTSTNVKTFTVQATWTSAGSIAATATGAVADLAPGQTRAAMLVTLDQIPDGLDAAQVSIGAIVVDAVSTPGASAAANLTFGPPRVTKNFGLSTVDVQVTNGDSAAHTGTLQAAFLSGDQLLGIATGGVADLAPGQVKTATLVLVGTDDGADQVLVAADAIVQ